VVRALVALQQRFRSVFGVEPEDGAGDGAADEVDVVEPGLLLVEPLQPGQTVKVRLKQRPTTALGVRGSTGLLMDQARAGVDATEPSAGESGHSLAP
jgi:hypothetical protein